MNEATPLTWIRSDRSGSIVAWADESPGFFGLSGSDVEGRSVQEVLDEATGQAFMELLDGLQPQGPGGMGVQTFLEGAGLRADGGTFPLGLTLVPCNRAEGEEVQEITVLLQDLSERRHVRSRLSLLESGVDLVGEALVVTDGRIEEPGPTIVYCNRSFATLFDSTPEELAARQLDQVIGPVLWERLLPMVVAGLEAGGPIAGEVVLTPAEKGETLLDWKVEPVRDQEGRVSNFLAVLRKVDGEQGLDEMDARLGLDPLTGLPDQGHFVNRLGRSVAWARDSVAYRYAVLCLELAGLDEIRGKLGATVALQVLKAAGWRLRRTVRPADLVARTAEDRLMVLLENPGKPHEIDTVLARARRELTLPFRVGDTSLRVDILVGMAFSDTGYRLPEEVVRDARRAVDLARSKRSSPGPKTAAADPERYLRSRVRAERIAHLRSGIFNGDEGRLVLLYHPILELETGRLEALETLLRWKSPQGDLFPPGEVLPLMEEGGLLGRLARRVMEATLEQIGQWKTELSGPIPPVTMNLSTVEILDPEFHDIVASVLHNAGSDADRFVFEIPEAAIRESPTAVRSALTRLSAPGTEFWVDGFGSHGTPLLEFRSLPIRRVKVRLPPAETPESGNGAGPGHDRVLDGLIAFTRALGVEAVAVGIEDEAQLEAARARGFVYGQGFHLSELLDSGHALALLKSANSSAG